MDKHVKKLILRSKQIEKVDYSILSVSKVNRYLNFEIQNPLS